MAMVRKQVYITKEQDEKLKQAAREEGVTEAELIRRALESRSIRRKSELDLALELIERLTRRRPEENDQLPWDRAGEDADEPRMLDPQDWVDELAFIELRAQVLPSGGSTVKWRREDSYDETERSASVPD